MHVVEKEAIVVNSADPEAIGRVQVFIYGVHDITGIKTPFETLPWAYSSTNVVTIPTVWTPLKVKSRIPFGRNVLTAFSEQDALEWHSPSHFIKLSADRDPRNFLTWDSEKQSFLNRTPADYAAINDRMQALKERKTQIEGNIEVIRNDLQRLEDESTNATAAATGAASDYEENKQEYEQTKKDLENLQSKQRELRKTKLNQLAVEFDSDEYYNNNVKESSAGGLTVDELFETNLPLYTILRESYVLPKINEFIAQQNLEINSLETKITFLTSEEKTLSDEVKELNELESNKTQNKIVVQKELDTLSQELSEIDKELADLESKGSSAPKASTSFDQIKSLDSRVGRFDNATGKVYNTDGELIGNWTGESFYVPGYALQAGPSIPERKKALPPKSVIKQESYLAAVNNNGSVSENSSTIITPPDSVAIDKSNKDKEHICDLSYETRMKILMKRESVLRAVTWLRDQIIAQFSIDKESATAQWVKAVVKQLTAMLKATQKFLKFVNTIVLEIAKLIAQIKQLIKWILSLPAILLALLQDCLTHFYNSIASSFSTSLNIGGVGGTDVSFAEVSELVTQAQSTLQTAADTVKNTTIVYAEFKSIEETFEKV